MLKGQGSISGSSKKFVSIPQSLDRLWSLPSLLANRNRGLFPPGGKEAGGSEPDNLLPSTAQIKNDGAIPPLPIVVMA
jgi:hypothetical protein